MFGLKFKACRIYDVQICILFQISLLTQRLVLVLGVPADNIEHDDVLAGSLLSVVVVSICVAISLVAFVILCSPQCWPLRYFQRGHLETSGYPNASLNSLNSPSHSRSSLAQIDVRDLELDPIVFEPLPTLHDMTPVHLRVSGESSSNLSQRNQHAAIVPFTSDESAIYAHDWFDEPFSNFPRGNVEYIKEIGRGWFGKVILAEAKDIVPYAKKIRVMVKVLREDATGLEQMRFLDESRLYRDSTHGNVLRLLGHSIEICPFLLLMEQCPQGNLKSFLISNVNSVELCNKRGDAVRMGMDIAKALEWMGSTDFVHGDLAARNCLIGSEGRIVIGDYGLSTSLFKDDYYWSSNIAIPLRWAAPETIHCTMNTIQTLRVTKLSNIWTFGILLWEICEFGKQPYFECTDDDVISRVVCEKNYILGQPTMTNTKCGQLYAIMKACWNPIPAERPPISLILSQLENLYQDFNTEFSSTKDDFDSKWEQQNIGPRSRDTHIINELSRKKSVRFMGMEQPKISEASTDKQPQLVTSETTIDDHSNKIVDPIPTPIAFQEFHAQYHEPQPQPQSLDSWKNDPEEIIWKTKIEHGEISEKVREKSHSVQDLMVLTHVEPSELYDSVPYDSDKIVPSPNNITVSKTDFTPNASQHSENSTSHLDQIGAQDLVKDILIRSSIAVPDIKVIPSTPVHNPNTKVNLLPTPDSDVCVNIVATQSSPSTTNSAPLQSEAECKYKFVIPTAENKPVKRFKFVFDDEEDVVASKARLTSTPSSDGDSRFDEITSEIQEAQCTGNIYSPANVEQNYSSPTNTRSHQPNDNDSSNRASFQSDDQSQNVSSSIVMGPSDELGLNFYQRVSTEIIDSSYCRENLEDAKVYEESNLSQTETDPNDYLSNIEDCSSVNSAETITNTTDFSQTPTLSLPTNITHKIVPRELFANNEVNEVKKIDEKPFSNQENMKSMTQTDMDTRMDSVHRSNDNYAGAGASDEEFWAKQMKSLKEATSDTLQLFQIGLDKDVVEEPKDDSREMFDEQIQAASQDFGSLRLQDLEDENQGYQILDEVRLPELSSEAPTSSITAAAFGGEVECALDDDDDDDESHSSWVLRNSVEVTKNYQCKTDNLTEDDNERLEVCRDFVPSIWNQNLVPVKPSIKSPEMLEEMKKDESNVPTSSSKSGLRKSVSFERKKINLVYEYPPPPPVSDSEEEEKKQANHLALSLDWELQPDELLDSTVHTEDWEEEIIERAKRQKSMDLYRISGFDSEESSPIHPIAVEKTHGSAHRTNTLGELRHTRERLKLDLCKGEASVLDEDAKNSNKQDSGMGSSTNVSPFTHCDNN